MRVFLTFLLIALLSVAVTNAQTDDGVSRQVVTNTLDDANPFREYPFTVVNDGSTIILDMTVVGDDPGNLDTFLYLLDSNGVIIDENDDRARGDLTSLIEYPLAAAGDYIAIATRYGVDRGSSFGQFELTIEVLPETPRLDLDYDVSPEALTAMGFPQIEPRPNADWTVFAYYGGDNNLEWGLQFDFNQFELGGGSTESVRILMMFDRSPEHSADNGDWRTLRLFEVQADVSDDATIRFPPTIDSEPLADFGVVDSGDGDTLAKFLVWGARHYPADNYAVAFASHGAAWQGIITDDSAAADLPRVPHTIISVPEMRRALELGTEAAGVERFNLLINDACSMSSIEYFSGVSPFFELSLASPEIIVDPALNMTLFTNRLKAERGGVDLVSLGQDLVDRYIETDMLLSGDLDAPYFTHALTDLTRFDPVTQAVENFARVFNVNPARYAQTLGAARANTYTYTHFAGSTDKIDLGSLMNLVIAETLDDELFNAAQRVLDALDDAIIYDNSGANIDGREDIAYYNIYFPESSSAFRVAYLEQTPLVQWAQMLRNYYNAVTPQIWTGVDGPLRFHPPRAPIITTVTTFPDGEVSVLNPYALRWQIEGRNLSLGDATFDYVQADGRIVRYGLDRILRPVIQDDGTTELENSWPEGVTDQVFQWEVDLPVVSDGTAQNNELVIIREEVAFLDGLYRGPNDENFSEVSVVFGNALNAPDGVGRTQRVISRATGSNALGVINIPPGSEFIALRSIVTEDGRVVVEEGNRYTWPADGLTYTNEPAPSGQYNIGLLMQAFGGTTAHVSTTVTVNHDTLSDSNLRASTRIEGGFTITRPKTWSLLATDETFADRTISPDGNSNIAVYYALEDFVDPNDIESVVDDVFFFYFPDVTWDRQYTPITVDGRPGIEFTFSYVDGAENAVDVRAFSAFTADGASGYVFTSEAVSGTGDIDGIYTQLLENIRIFPFFNIREGGGAYWASNTLSDRVRDLNDLFEEGTPNPVAEVEHPIPATWRPFLTDAGWIRYAANANPASPTFITLGVVLDTENIADVIDDVSINIIAEGAEGIRFASQRTLNTRYHRWTARPFEVERGGVTHQGRLYATVENERVYLVWVETPDNENLQSFFVRLFEPVVDGIQIKPLSE